MTHSSGPLPLRPSHPPGRERRASVRYTIPGAAEWFIHVLVGEETCTAAVRDISIGGIGFLINRQLEPGNLIRVELTNASQLFSDLRQARVAHVLPQVEGNFLTGCQFAEPLTYEQIYALLCR